MRTIWRIILALTISTNVCCALASAGDTTNVYVRKDSSFVLPLLNDDLMLLQEAPDVLEEGLTPFDENDSIQRYIDLARMMMDKLKTSQNFIKTFDASTKFELPVGISKTIGGLKYDIAIYAVRIKPEFAELDVFMSFEIPQNKKVLTFMAKNIKVSNKGGIIGDAKLELLTDNAINFSGDKIQLLIKGSKGHTYAVMDCDGFKQMSLDADIIFSRDFLLPENLNGTPQPEGRVTASFSTILNNWNDFVVQITLPDFQVRGLNGVGFNVRDAVFDFSDFRNAPNVKFPQGYTSTLTLPDNSNLWRGIYIRELSVRLPQEFKQNTQSGRTTFQGHDLIIDQTGFTGTIVATNLIGIKDGDMNGWTYSLDSLGVSLESNQLVEAGFKGDIVIPIADEKKPFHYNAIINTGGNYLFSVTSASDISFPLWQAGKVEIYKASYLEVKMDNGNFLPKANLHGKMNIQARVSEGGQGVELAEIKFENLVVQSVRPYVSPGTFSFGSEAMQQKMAGFPVSIQDIGCRAIGDSQLALDFNLKVNLVGEKDGAFGADAGLSIIGAMGAQQQWKYKEIEVRDITIDVDQGAFKFHGKLVFYRNDKMYGDGFNGMVKAEFMPKIKLDASAIFGNTGGLRYWYVDGMVQFKPGIPIVPGAAVIGFGGGAYYGMKLDKTGAGSELGRTASGIVYIPDERSGLGLKASIMVSAATEEAFNARATIEILFYKGGGVRYVSLMGNAFIASTPVTDKMSKLQASTTKMLDAMKKAGMQASAGLMEMGKNNPAFIESIQGPIGTAAGKEGAISARVFIEYDFDNSALHANFSAGVDVAGGLIKGGGEAVLHFAPGEWYVYIGTPDNRFNLGFGIGSIRANADAYFMVGTKIPGSPPPPEAVSRILGGGNYDYMKDLNTIAGGGGFAFGTSFSINTGEIQFLIFYARFEAGAGFDIMLKNYGDARCEGRSERLGINGWYANGQAYAYFDGEVGIKVDLFFVHGKFKILGIGAAALLQAKLPNPSWFRGAVGGRFSILNGLVEGNCKFEVTLGTECKIAQKQENVLAKVSVISQVTPAQGERDVNVFNTPQVVFNMPVEKNFDLSENGKQRSFRIKLDQFKLSADGKDVPGSMEWNDGKDVVAFNTPDVLPPMKPIKVFVQVTFEELINGSWAAVFFEGKKVLETAEVTFTTGPAPDNIPLSNVEYSYPVVNQLNYYKDETREGFIKLKKGQPYLFEPGPEWKQIGRVASAGGPAEFPIQYANMTVRYQLPAALTNASIYAFDLMNIPAQKTGAVDRNVSEVKNQVIVGDQSANTEIKTRQAQGSIEALQEKSIFGMHFRTSAHSTLAAKIAALNFSQGWTWAIQTGIYELGVTSTGSEFFDSFEFIGSNYDPGKLVQIESDLSGNPWFENSVQPLIYENYPINARMTLLRRQTSVLGIPPVRAVYMRQSPSDLSLTDQSILANLDISTKPAAMGIIYNMPLELYRDYLDLQASAANLPASERSPRSDKLLLLPFPQITAGIYKINIKHVLPGTRTVTSVNPYSINYTVVFVR